MARLKDKIVLITGAAGAIGAAAAKVIAGEGGVAVTSDIAAQMMPHALDVTSEADWLRVVADIEREHGRLDGLLNAAGIAALGTVEDTDYATWKKIMAVNLDGTFLGCKHAIPVMLGQGGGTIVNTASVAGLFGGPGMPAYVASKHGVVAVSEVLFHELRAEVVVSEEAAGVLVDEDARADLGIFEHA